MSRIQRFIHNASSSSALLILSTVYALASLSVAARFLSKDEFGLWATCMTIVGYLNMLDMGMSTSMGRLLVDHKDRRNTNEYGSMLKTGMMVFALQGTLIFVIGTGLSFVTPFLLNIDEPLRKETVWLMLGVTCTTTANFLTRIFSQVLTSHQRSDVYSYTQMTGLIFAFIALWVSLKAGFGVFSLLAASSANWLVQTILCFRSCHRLGFWPRAGEWGPFSRQKFRELFVYATDLFLIGLGAQFIAYSQPALVARTLGLEAAGVWAVMTKAWTLVSQLLWRTAGVSLPAFAEMQVQGDTERMWRRYRDLFSLSAAMSAACGIIFAVCNRPFVAWLMHGKYSWPLENDWLLAVWVVLLTEQYCHNSMIMCLKKIEGLKFVYIVEGVVFVTLALMLTPHGGISTMLICSNVCTLAFIWSYGTYRIAKMNDIPVRQLLIDWQKPLFLMTAALLPLALLLVYLTRDHPPFIQFLERGVPLGIVAAYILCKKCLSAELAARVRNLLPRQLRPCF